MIITACYILHYGREWLQHSILSIKKHVDNIQFFYTPQPSFGYVSDIPNPEASMEPLRDIAINACNGAEFRWWDLRLQKFAHEGEHRTFAVNRCWMNGADLVLVVDADELWPSDVLSRAIELVKHTSARTFRIGMQHWFRSLYWVCNDPAAPTRFIKRPGTNYEKEEEYLPGLVCHMGYAQSSALVKYKMSIHGHKMEIRNGWFDNIFMQFSPENPLSDVHPTNEKDFWHPVPYGRYPFQDGDNGVLETLTTNPLHEYRSLEIIP